MIDAQNYQNNPRDYAEAYAEGFDAYRTMLTACLKYMSPDDVRDMLDANEMSPRFIDTDDDEFDANDRTTWPARASEQA